MWRPCGITLFLYVVYIWCADCPCINLPDQETTKEHEETTPSIRFQIYHIIGRCTAHGIIPPKEKKICYMYEQEFLPDSSTNIHTRKELVMTETTISDFHTSFYIPAIQSWIFTYHMCAYLVQIIVVKCYAQPSNDVNYLKMFYVAVSMLIG